MRQADINRLSRAAEHIQAAITHLEKVYDNTEAWQGYRTKQHLNALREEHGTLQQFADLMKKEPDFQHKDWGRYNS